MAVRLDHPKKCFVSWDPTLRNRCEGSNSASMAFQKAMQRILINDSEINSQVEG
jgi:cell division protein FtsI (penicillin-binding protein 3)